MVFKVPEHWGEATWEQKAQENPLYAVMTTSEMESAPADDFSPELLETFFAKGRDLYDVHVAPLIGRSPDAPADTLVAEYGCGAGRILKAVRGAGYRCVGIDISQTMLEHCKRLVPDVEALYLLDENGRSAMASGSASVAYSYAVVQHISSLKNYITAIDEICRVVKPGGVVGIQVNCDDFQSGDLEAPWRTENFEDHSVHYKTGEEQPYKHKQDHWSGVYIGHDYFRRLLAERGVRLERWYYHNPAKLRAVWAVGVKEPTAA